MRRSHSGTTRSSTCERTRSRSLLQASSRPSRRCGLTRGACVWRPFSVYLDEFQSFTTRSLATMTAELRKYGIGVIASHQYLEQVEPEVINAVLGNAGTIIAFRLGPRDAAALAGEFHPKFGPADLM